MVRRLRGRADRAGRAGRAGKVGKALKIVLEDSFKLSTIIDNKSF